MLRLITGQVRWSPQTGLNQVLEGDETVYEIAGSGSLTFVHGGRYAWFDGHDLLGFGIRAPLYQSIMEPRNREIGEAFVQRFPLSTNETWVDIGTGTSAIVQALQSYSRQQGVKNWIIGIDGADGLIEQAWSHQTDTLPARFIDQDLSGVR